MHRRCRLRDGKNFDCPPHPTSSQMLGCRPSGQARGQALSPRAGQGEEAAARGAAVITSARIRFRFNFLSNSPFASRVERSPRAMRRSWAHRTLHFALGVPSLAPLAGRGWRGERSEQSRVRESAETLRRMETPPHPRFSLTLESLSTSPRTRGEVRGRDPIQLSNSQRCAAPDGVGRRASPFFPFLPSHSEGSGAPKRRTL